MSRATEQFEIQTRLAVGDAGLIYRAVDQSGRVVALKLLLTEELVAHPLDVDALLRDAPGIQTITGVNIVQLLDAFPDEDGTVLVYEYAEGLRGLDVPNKRPISAEHALDVAAQLLSALRSGERQQYPHGDLKPSDTVLVDLPDGRPLVMVLDWGLANYRRELSAESFAYTAPERLAGSPPSHVADLFSAGAVLHYLFTGRRLLPCTTREEFAAGWPALDVNALAELRPDLPKALVSWISNLISPDPLQRPDSAVKALEALNALHPPLPPSVPEKIRPRPVRAVPVPQAVPQPAPSRVQPRPVSVAQPAPAVAPEKVIAAAQKEIAQLQKKRQSIALLSTYLLVAVGLGAGIWVAVKKFSKSTAPVADSTTADLPMRDAKAPAPKSASPAAAAPQASTVPVPEPAPEPAPERAVFPVQDSFEYTVGMPLAGLSGGLGWDGPWAGDPTVLVEPESVSFGKTPAFGGSLIFKPSAADVIVSRYVARSAELIDPLKGGVFFFAITLKHSDKPFGPESEFQFNALDATGSGKQPIRVIIGDKGKGFEISMNDRTVIAPAPNGGNSLCIVQRYDIKPEPSGKWTISAALYINPKPGPKLPEKPNLSLVLKGAALPAKQGLVLRKKPTPTTLVDEVRYCKKWTEVFR